jgi:glycine/D-amino acid oxidase-like deaminating enzyme
VDPSWLPRIYLPYDGLLAAGRVVRDRAAKIDAGRVELASGGQIEADYIVLATGSAYPFLAKSDIRALIAGTADLAAYEPSPPTIIVPVGPEGGSGQLAGSDDLASAEMVANAKGRDMLVDRFVQLLGVNVPAEQQNR